MIPQLDRVEWHEFKQKMKSFHVLTWEFSERSKMVDFIILGYVNHATPYVLFTPHEKIYTSHLNLHPTQFP